MDSETQRGLPIPPVPALKDSSDQWKIVISVVTIGFVALNYCSQLAYLACLKHDIDLNTGVGVPKLPFSDRIVFPQEIWEGYHHLRAEI